MILVDTNVLLYAINEPGCPRRQALDNFQKLAIADVYGR
jgi:predicted nucleic acid-binding protein